MEELNLPPGLIAFVRKNAKMLQIGLICVAVLVVAWVLYDYYSIMQEKKGVSLLASAMQTEPIGQQVAVLENVIKDYSRTNAARWAKIELANLDYKEERYESAIAKYKEVLDALPAKNPLIPLTRLSLAQSYEQTKQYDNAINQYNLLKKQPGFAIQAYLGLGRLYVAKNDTAQASNAYKELLDTLGDRPDQTIVSQIEEKLAALSSAKSAMPSQAVENKE